MKAIYVRFLLISIFAMSCVFESATAQTCKVRLTLKDKHGSDIVKRLPGRRMQMTADSLDYDVSPVYISMLNEIGFEVCSRSRWMNSVVVTSHNQEQLELLVRQPFVTSAEVVWRSFHSDFIFTNKNMKRLVSEKSVQHPINQITVHNGDLLHSEGYTGYGIQIAVVDAGFGGVDYLPMINGNVLGSRDFASPGGDVNLEDSHGTKVLSCISAREGSRITGSAPDASFWLFRSEVSDYEFPIEEDFWVEAVEYAESLGVDIINSSLGYFNFDDDSMNYTWDHITGNDAFITRAASIASDKGILLVISAGNEGNKSWGKITFPSDSPKVLTVGAVTNNLEPAIFTGEGFYSFNVAKPDVSAFGAPAYYLDTNGQSCSGYGTSFSTPIIAGLCACLWQAFPDKTNFEIMDMVKSCASLKDLHDLKLGYGVPDFFEAYRKEMLTSMSDGRTEAIEVRLIDKASSLYKVQNSKSLSKIIVYSSDGMLVRNLTTDDNGYFQLKNLLPGFYIICIENGASISSVSIKI